MSAPTCRSCGIRIQFGTTERGKVMPVDFSATDDGNVVWERDGIHIHVLSNAEKLTDTRPRFLSHFASCPEAANHRRLGKDQS